MIFLFLLGLFIGSFLGVLVDRLPFGKNFFNDRSKCEFCGHTLSAFDLFPVLSFVFLHAKCRYCHKKLSYFYPIIELTTGFSFAFAYLFMFSPFYSLPFTLYPFPFVLFILSSFIVIFFTDLKYRIIPNAIVYPAIGITFMFLFINHNSYILNHSVSALGALLFFLALFVGTKGRGMGFGDVQLSFLLGLLLGFPNIVIALYLAFLTGAAVSLILMIGKKFSIKDSVPFGPFLIVGSLIALFWGSDILIWFPYF